MKKTMKCKVFTTPHVAPTSAESSVRLPVLHQHFAACLSASRALERLCFLRSSPRQSNASVVVGKGANATFLSFEPPFFSALRGANHSLRIDPLSSGGSPDYGAETDDGS